MCRSPSPTLKVYCYYSEMPEKSPEFTQENMPLKILIVKHSVGNKFGGPAEDLEQYLVSEYPDASITVLSHPLTPWSAMETSMKVYSKGVLGSQTVRPRRIKGAARHLFDVFFGPKRSEYDLVFGFNSWALFLGVLSCKNKDAKVVAWGVDFVPLNNADRSGFLNFFLTLLEKLLTQRINVRVENTGVALMEREIRSKLTPLAKSFVVPIGVWRKDYFQVEDLEKKSQSKLVYLGAINERTGAPLLVEILDELNKMKVDFTCDIIGDGPLMDWLKIQIRVRGLERKVIAHGYLPDFPDTRQILSIASIGLAPFSADLGNFTFFTDPQKVRRYLASGLVVISSKVPPIARELSIDCGLVGLEPHESSKSWADAIADLLGNPKRLRIAQRASLEYAETFENARILGRFLEQVLKN